MFRFFTIGWPRVVRDHAQLVAIATAIVGIGGLSGAFYAAADPGFLPLVASSDVLAGTDLTGSPLAKTPAERSFRVEDQTIIFNKGDLVRCDHCHGMPDL